MGILSGSFNEGIFKVRLSILELYKAFMSDELGLNSLYALGTDFF